MIHLNSFQTFESNICEYRFRIIVGIALGAIFFSTYPGSETGLITWLAGLVRFYFLWFPVHFLTGFNPSETYVKSRPVRFLNWLVRMLTCGLFPRLFGGTWYNERDETLKIIRASLNSSSSSNMGAFYAKIATK